MPFEELTFPAGTRLLARWQANDSEATQRLTDIFDATLSGRRDEVFRTPTPHDSVHVSGSIDLMTLGIMYDL